MILELSKSKVEIKNELSWWDLQEINSVQMSGVQLDNTGLKGFDSSSMFKATVKLIEKSIISINADGADIKYSEDWLRTLSVSDGDMLYDAVQKLSNPAKKN